MNYFEIKPDGQAFIRTDSGTVIRKVGNGEAVNHAEFNRDETLFVITYNNGRCDLRDRKNNLVKQIAEEGVKEAYFRPKTNLNKQKNKSCEEVILIVMKDGSSVLWDE